MSGEGVEFADVDQSVDLTERALRAINRDLRSQVADLTAKEQVAREESLALQERLARLESLMVKQLEVPKQESLIPHVANVSPVVAQELTSQVPSPSVTAAPVESAFESELSFGDKGKGPAVRQQEQSTLMAEPVPSTSGSGLPHVSPSVYATPGAEAPAMFTNLLYELVQEVKEIKLAGIQQQGTASEVQQISSVATPNPVIPQFQESDVQRHVSSSAAISEALSLDDLVELRVKDFLAKAGFPASGSVFPQVYTVQAPDLQPKGLDFKGDSSPGEKVTAAELIQMLEAYRVAVRDKLPLSDGELMWIAARNFARGSLAAGWWNTRVSEAPPGQTPFPSWAEFRNAFLLRFTRPYEAISLRAKLKDAQCEKGNVPGYISLWRHCLDRLALLGEGMAMGDIILNFTRGLPPSLARKVPLNATSFERMIQKVEEEYARRQNFNTLLGQPREPRPKLHNVEDAEEAEDWEPDLRGESEEDAEFYALGNRGDRGRSQRNRGRGRGGRGGRFGSRPPWTEQQQQWFNEGKCLKCGKVGHKAVECPAERTGQENRPG